MVHFRKIALNPTGGIPYRGQGWDLPKSTTIKCRGEVGVLGVTVSVFIICFPEPGRGRSHDHVTVTFCVSLAQFPPVTHKKPSMCTERQLAERSPRRGASRQELGQSHAAGCDAGASLTLDFSWCSSIWMSVSLVLRSSLAA